MRRLELDFQPRRSGRLVWAVAGLSLVSFVGLLWVQQSLESEQVALQGRLHQAEQKLGTGPRPQPTLSASQRREQDERLAQMRSVSEQLQRPWEHLFAMLEGMPLEDVALLALSPDARKGQLRIAAEARDLEAMLAFHKRLEASTELRDVSLLNHEIVVRQAEHPVQFNLSATWETGNAHP